MESLALVTGANAGMGYATCVELLKRGMRVVALCRSPERGAEALARMKAESGSGKAELLVCDLGSLASIKTAAGEFLSRYRTLDVLVNNAGLITTKRQVTADGFEMQLGVNHLGHFALTLQLLPALRAATAARVVVVSSGAHKIGRIHQDPQLQKGWSSFKAYAQSKLATLLFGLELARRLEGSAIKVNICHPGAVGTSIGVDRSSGFGKGIMGFLGHFFLTPAQGADTTVWLATSPEGGEKHGVYWVRRKPASMSRRAGDPAEAARLWKLSEELTAQAWK